MRKVTSNLYLGNIGEFGDANVLAAAGIELAFLCQGGMGFPHATVPAIALTISSDGSSPDWFIQAGAKLLAVAYQFKVIGVFDQGGGLDLGAFMVTCAAAEKLGGSFATRSTQLKALIPEMNILQTLVNQGQRLYP